MIQRWQNVYQGDKPSVQVKMARFRIKTSVSWIVMDSIIVEDQVHF